MTLRYLQQFFYLRLFLIKRHFSAISAIICATINAISAIFSAIGVNYGVIDNGNSTNGVEVPLNKEQAQIEKLLQIIEKNPSATQAYYAEEIGVSKRTVSRMFASLQEKGRLVQNGTKRKANWKIIR